MLECPFCDQDAVKVFNAEDDEGENVFVACCQFCYLSTKEFFYQYDDALNSFYDRTVKEFWFADEETAKTH